MKVRHIFHACATAALAISAPLASPAAAERTSSSVRQAPAAERLTPRVDHHQHIASLDALKLFTPPAQAAVSLPSDLQHLLDRRVGSWNDGRAMSGVFTADAMVLGRMMHPTWLKGGSDAARFFTSMLGKPYQMVPVAFGTSGHSGWIAGNYTRGAEPGGPLFGHFLLSLAQDEAGSWRISAEAPTFSAAPPLQERGTDALVRELDEAGIRRAALLSVAYWFGSPLGPPATDELARVRAENDFTVAQAQRHPGRFVTFCSFNPLREYAVAELERCASLPTVKGIKLHLGNSATDLRKADQAAKVRAVFAAANARRLAIVLHLWTDPSFERDGAQFASIVLDQLLPAAPDVPIQIAHMAGGGRMTDTAVGVFAEAAAARDPRVRNLYFDVATSVSLQVPPQELDRLAQRIRQIGVNRILYGSDASDAGANPRQGWGMFRAFVPLSDAELRTIAGNVAPYMN
jgi:predicted TIM-barrel fold metal-dependent hydrolase